MAAEWECTGGCDGELPYPCDLCEHWSPARIEAFTAWARGDLSYDDWARENARLRDLTDRQKQSQISVPGDVSSGVNWR